MYIVFLPYLSIVYQVYLHYELPCEEVLVGKQFLVYSSGIDLITMILIFHFPKNPWTTKLLSLCSFVYAIMISISLCNIIAYYDCYTTNVYGKIFTWKILSYLVLTISYMIYYSILPKRTLKRGYI